MTSSMLNRHWHAQSEKYTGADSLLTALQNGWVMKMQIRQEEFQRHSRLVQLFHIELERAGEVVEMVIIANPYVRSFISAHFPLAVSAAS